jgi:hypothetical protein
MSCDDAQQPAAGQVGAGQAGSGAGVGVGVVKHRGPRRSNSNGSNARASEAEVFKRAKVVKDMVTAVFKQKKVFTLFGGPGYADDIRQGLLRRGWIERPPPRETDAYVLDPPPTQHTQHTHTHSSSLSQPTTEEIVWDHTNIRPCSFSFSCFSIDGFVDLKRLGFCAIFAGEI